MSQTGKKASEFVHLHLHTQYSLLDGAIRLSDLFTVAQERGMHAVAMTSRPSLLYWSPETIRIMHAIHDWRAEGLASYFTIDAGANVHVLYLGENTSVIETRLRALPGVQDVIANRPGPGTRLVADHLF